MNAATPACQRRRITIGGCVQGVGFRPFVYHLANKYGLAGSVANATNSVIIEIEGDSAALDNFLNALRSDAPAQARIDSLHSESIGCQGDSDFSILESESTVSYPAELTLPLDLAICDNCRHELFDPHSRRYRHAFIACCDCGPRWSSLAALPWQRNNTALADFALCAACAAEYRNPDDRRFHAQNNCCPQCGPQLALWNRAGAVLAEKTQALAGAVAALQRGAIVAVKGLGGFHLMVDARNSDAIARLRERKQRPHKPLAVMFATIEQLQMHCDINAEERELLSSRAAPIVLVSKRDSLPEIIAPQNPRLGAMLAYTPLHLLLLHDAGFPLVATSGNVSGEPICADEHDALATLHAIADYFLVHDRPILNPIDDSVVQIAAGRPMLLRCARGYAPLDFRVSDAEGKNFLALGGEQKNCVALADGGRIRLSPHSGDLGSSAGDHALRRSSARLRDFSSAATSGAVCDLHPDYRSSQLAYEYSARPLRVQHHHAHIAAVMGEHALDGAVLGIAWDGSGFGADGTLWGGEFLLAARAHYTRVAALRDFALPGGDSAAREPRRVALSLLHAMSGGDVQRYADLPLLHEFSAAELSVLQTMLARQLNCPRTSSIGRLFDAVAALLGLQSIATFEGQAAMALQFAAERHKGSASPFAFGIDKTGAIHRIDWQPLLEEVIAAIRANVEAALIAARFHATLAAFAATIAKNTASKRIALAGGCFQNRLLLETTVTALREIDCAVFWPQRLPPNDGALALGQAIVAREFAR